MIGKLSVICLVTLSAFALNASPFDDVKFWFNGGRPSHGNGTAVTGDFFDAAHASDPAHGNHMSKFYGYEENRRLVTEDVTFPMSGETRATQVLRLSDTWREVDGKYYSYPGLLSIHALRDNLVREGVPSDKFTIIMRVRRDGSYPNLDQGEWFFQWGYTGFYGLLFGFNGNELNAKGEDVGKRLVAYWRTIGADGKETLTSKTFNSDYQMYVPTNVWTDIGISVDGSNIQMVMARAKTARPPSVESWRSYPIIGFASISGAVKVNNLFVGTTSHDTMFSGSRFILGAQSGTSFDNALEIADPTATTTTAFNGAFQQLAIWDRALSKDEMLEAFGEPRPQIVKVGLANGSANEFGADRPSSGRQTIDATASYAEKSAKLAAGDETTFTFVGRAEEAGLRQIAVLKTVEPSAGTFELTVNGVACGTVSVNSRGVAKWTVPGTALVSGANAIVLKRTDTKAGEVTIDVFTLGGSWQMGLVNNFATESFALEADIQAFYQGGADMNLRHWTSMFATYGLSQDIRFRFWVDENVAAESTSTWTMPMKMFSNGTPEKRVGGEYLLVSLNGAEKDRIAAGPGEWPASAIKNIKYEFAPKELKAGWNELNVQFCPKDGSGKYTAYIKNDYYRFECGKLQKGMLIIFR